MIPVCPECKREIDLEQLKGLEVFYYCPCGLCYHQRRDGSIFGIKRVEVDVGDRSLDER